MNKKHALSSVMLALAATAPAQAQTVQAQTVLAHAASAQTTSARSLHEKFVSCAIKIARAELPANTREKIWGQPQPATVDLGGSTVVMWQQHNQLASLSMHWSGATPTYAVAVRDMAADTAAGRAQGSVSVSGNYPVPQSHFEPQEGPAYPRVHVLKRQLEKCVFGQ